MFGLTLEKLMLVAIVAAIVVGPRRLPVYAGRLAQTIRALRSFVETARVRAAEQTGLPLADGEWQALDLRQYDPRRIVREALTADLRPVAGVDPVADAEEEGEASPPWTAEQIARIRPGQRFVTVGGPAHPTRLPIASLAPDDPVRRAAEAGLNEDRALDEGSESLDHAAVIRTSPSMTG